MPGPIVHLLWGYMVGRSITKNEDHLFIGLAASVVLDIPFIFDLSGFHRISAHNLLFALILSLAMFMITREFGVFVICIVNMILHLILDTIFSNSPVRWFDPFYSLEIGVTRSYGFHQFWIIYAFLTSIPIIYMIYKFYRYKENPFDLIPFYFDRYLGKHLSRGNVIGKNNK